MKYADFYNSICSHVSYGFSAGLSKEVLGILFDVGVAGLSDKKANVPRSSGPGSKRPDVVRIAKGNQVLEVNRISVERLMRSMESASGGIYSSHEEVNCSRLQEILKESIKNAFPVKED